MVANSQGQFEQKFEEGKAAFDRGRYRQSIVLFEEAVKLSPGASRRGGEAQLWLAMAHQAAGDVTTAKQICRRLVRHPHPECRKQGQQVLEILQAPQLTRPKEWLTPIPDLTNQENSKPATPRMVRRSGRSKPEPPPIRFEDTRRMNTKDNGFIFAAIAFLAVLLGVTYWWSS
ncbi:MULTISPECIES: tetratricopeptide repeat protein [unclassified Synechocystis]|uniref:tetratricopeptide repeat protein n=1 Tax=unclassified Synechocystis TaxID=2640012 RepID=UPI00048BC038|nr:MULTISPECIES: tetratricopeptide repeat protein [unclassified Synechocystis]MCT0253348.1 tetratricopeptide repeat protein [Synechocystis sp. CS-94]